MNRIHVLIFAVLCAGCVSVQEPSRSGNPLGWPAKAVTWAGNTTADSGIPVVREVGRVIRPAGELLDGPAVFVEGILTLNPKRLIGGCEKVLAGTGASLSAVPCVAFSFLPGRNIDLAKDADNVNSALEHIANQPGRKLFPPGTKVTPKGKVLVWHIPGSGRFSQAAQASWWFNFQQRVLHMDYYVQERSWGFIVRNSAFWDRRSDRNRTLDIIHEFYHQHRQIREVFHGWGPAYWIAYGACFIFTGWEGHWAEDGSSIGAQNTNDKLNTWKP